jgi:hypothetical protein
VLLGAELGALAGDVGHGEAVEEGGDQRHVRKRENLLLRRVRGNANILRCEI